MQHFKDFLIKIQTIGIRISRKMPVRPGGQETNYYDISHENPFLNPSFSTGLKELKELAITDMLNLPREQANFQLQRLDDLKELFRKFWAKYYQFEIPRGNQQILDLVLRLGLDEIFIAPRLMFYDHATAGEEFLNDLEETIRYREKLLSDFEQAVVKVINVIPAIEKVTDPEPVQKEIKAIPAFHEEIIPQFYAVLKNYVSPGDNQRLMNLLNGITSGPILYKGKGNQLADAFRQLYDANFIAGCNKVELQDWISVHFHYLEKGVQKAFTDRYLQDMISSNTKSCQAPLFDIRRSEGRLYLFALTRIQRK